MSKMAWFNARRIILIVIVIVDVINISYQSCDTRYLSAVIECTNITDGYKILDNVRYSIYSRYNGRSNVKLLIITESQVSVFTKSLIPPLTSLRNVSISGSGIERIDSSFQTSRLTLSAIDLNHNVISKLQNNVFDGVDGLKILILSHNHIEIIEPNSINPSIESLDLSYNRIKVLPATNLATRLHTINLSHNNISEITNNFFDEFNRLKNVRMDFNNIEKIDVSGIKNLIETLDLSHNNIRDITPISRSFLKLINLYLSNNLISEIPKQAFESFEFLENLYLGDNKLHEKQGEDNLLNILGHIKSVQHLNLYNNSLNIIDLNVLINAGSILYLNLGNNINFNITTIKECKNLVELDISMTNSSVIPIDAFANNIVLKSLNLSHNNIEVLYTGTFSKLISLRFLDLTGNKLKALQSGLFYRSNLYYLSVANNRLVTFNLESLNRDRSPSSINLDNNLWSCDSLSQIIHHLDILVKWNYEDGSLVKEGNHYSEPNIKGNLCTLNSTISETNVTIEEILIKNLEVMSDIREYLEDQELVNERIINKFNRSLVTRQNNSYQNNVDTENQTLVDSITGIDKSDKISAAPLSNSNNENFVYVKSSILIWLLCIQTLFMSLITGIIFYYLKFRRNATISNGALLYDMNESL